MESKKSSRREFVKDSARAMGLLAMARTLSAFAPLSMLAKDDRPNARRSILVLIQLVGGNDGLNTVIPYTDDRYYRLRPTLAVAPKSVLKLTDSIGLHPACRGLHQLYHEGKLAVIQGVGYAQPNRSHFGAAEIWDTGSSSGPVQSTGWLGRYLDDRRIAHSSPHDPVAVHFSTRIPGALVSLTDQPILGFNQPRPPSSTTVEWMHRMTGSYRPSVTFPASPFGQSLRHTAALIAADTTTQFYHVSLGGFDTHSHQVNPHHNLLQLLSEGLQAFHHELQARHLDDQVLTLTYSEFGRRAAENDRRGTDHGTAQPVLVMHPNVKGGVQGESPLLPEDPHQDLVHTIDHDRIYGTILEKWLGCPSCRVLGQPVQPLAFI